MEDTAGMAIHEQAKCLLVACQYLRHNGCVTYFHSNNLDRN